MLSTYLGFSESETRFFQVVTSLIPLANIAGEAAEGASGETLQLGNFALTDVREGDSGFAGAPTTLDALTELGTKNSAFFDALEDVNGGSASVPDSQAGFDLNFLEHPEEFFKLFLGESNVNLFTFTMPTLDVGVAKRVPIIGPLALPPFPFPIVTWELGVEGSLGLQGDLMVGYDARGLVDFQADPGHSPDLLSNGFYIDTTKDLLTIAGWDPNAGAIDLERAGLWILRKHQHQSRCWSFRRSSRA